MRMTDDKRIKISEIFRIYLKFGFLLCLGIFFPLSTSSSEISFNPLLCKEGKVKQKNVMNYDSIATSF